jgi:hypothetical protein
MVATRQLYAVVSPRGRVLKVEGTEQAAVAAARKDGRPIVDRSVDLGSNIEQNPLGSRGPEIAWQAIGRLRIDPRAVERMSLEESWQRLQKFFPQKKGDIVLKAYDSPLHMADNLLGQNAKLSATDLLPAQRKVLRQKFGKDVISVLGLSTLPNVVWSRLTKGPKINTCVGASRECAEACLVYSGRNEADPYNTVVKTARLSALMQDPNAFGRMLWEACKRHWMAPRATFAAFVRFNVFSDIPWELVFPEIFSFGKQAYDYTKVPGRRTPPNYDLTFSYSGRNFDDMQLELSRGRRVAVVFLTEKHKLPNTFLGYHVVDGDLSDARPLDPAPSIVGLAYKRPRKAGVVVSAKDNVFVVPVHELDGKLVAAIVPREQPGIAEMDSRENVVPLGYRLPIIAPPIRGH